MSLPGDTVYIVHHQASFRREDFKQKAHPQVDSIRRFNFYLNRNEDQPDTFWQYTKKAIEFTNDSVYVTSTNNLYKIKKELINKGKGQVIAPSLLMSTSNRELFFLPEEKHVAFESKPDCEYLAYVVGFGSLFFRPE